MVPFETQNVTLAFALHTAGCKAAPPEQRGPAQNHYPLEFLQRKKIGKGKRIEDAARDAVKYRIPGIVTYYFEQSPELTEALDAWVTLQKELDRAETEKEAPTIPEISTKTVMRVLCLYAQNLPALKALAFQRDPLVSVSKIDSEEPVSNGPNRAPGRRIKGSAKIWSINASEETKKHLKIA